MDIVKGFKVKTEELFHVINRMGPSEIEELTRCHIQEKLDRYSINAEIADVVLSGSRCRGLEREDSDIDVIVELATDEREDFLFDILNEDMFHIDGILVDINPITRQRTGTLEDYLPQVEEYLKERGRA